VKIDVMDDGKVHVFASGGKSAEEALKMIRDVTATAEMGKDLSRNRRTHRGVRRIRRNFPGTDGLLHISEIAEARIRAVRDELKEGDQILVKVLAIEGKQNSLKPQGGVARSEAKGGDRQLRKATRRAETGRS